MKALLIFILVVAMAIAAAFYTSRFAVKRQLKENATIFCKDGVKWIRDRSGNEIMWVNPDGTSPTCKL